MSSFTKFTLKTGSVLLLLACLSACGQKGDLFLPPDIDNSKEKAEQQS